MPELRIIDAKIAHTLSHSTQKWPQLIEIYLAFACFAFEFVYFVVYFINAFYVFWEHLSLYWTTNFTQSILFFCVLCCLVSFYSVECVSGLYVFTTRMILDCVNEYIVAPFNSAKMYINCSTYGLCRFECVHDFYTLNTTTSKDDSVYGWRFGEKTKPNSTRFEFGFIWKNSRFDYNFMKIIFYRRLFL